MQRLTVGDAEVSVLRRLLAASLVGLLIAGFANVGGAQVPSTPGTEALPGSDVGVFAGTVEEGVTETHTYDNDPRDRPCAAVLVPYTVHLAYQPADAVLELAVDHRERTFTAEGEDGSARVSFLASECTSFDVNVTGLAVEDEAAYGVVVEDVSCTPTGETCPEAE
jgi:hypothetical protein